MKRLILALFFAASTFAQSQIGGGTGGAGVPTSVSAAVGATNILAEYQFQASETCAAAVDYSGNGNNISSTAGVAPLIIAKTGGCNFLGNGALITPAAVNTAQAITIFMAYQPPGPGGQIHNVIVGGNGGGTTTGCNAIDIQQFNAAFASNEGAYKVMTSGNNVVIDTTLAGFAGIGTLTWSFGTTQGGGADDDKVWINGQHPGYINTASGLRSNNTHPYQIGGAAAGSCLSTINYMTGQIYWVVFWKNEPTDQQEAVARNFIVNAMANRGVGPVAAFSTNPNDDVLVLGDSISTINGTTITESVWHWLANNAGALLRPQPSVANVSVTGYTVGTNLFPTYRLNILPYLNNTAGNGTTQNDALNTLYIFAGTNDACASSTGCQALFDKESMMCRDWKVNGGNRCIVATMLSRTGNDTGKNLFDTVITQSYSIWFDQIADYAANPALGADGANASTNYFLVDAVHPNQSSEYNIILPQISHILNQNNASPSFSQGNKYSVTATAAVAVTAATEAGNTMTFTTAANTFTQGACIIVTGVTPAGYNTPANQCWTALTTPNSTTFTAYNNTTGLGALTVAGTASVPQEVDIDGKFATLAQCTTCTHTLEPCAWHLGQSKRLKITSTSAWTITPWQSSETINGGATFTAPVSSATNQPVVLLEAIRGTPSASGCTWSASLQ